jgi:hypothetical protein
MKKCSLTLYALFLISVSTSRADSNSIIWNCKDAGGKQIKITYWRYLHDQWVLGLEVKTSENKEDHLIFNEWMKTRPSLIGEYMVRADCINTYTRIEYEEFGLHASLRATGYNECVRFSSTGKSAWLSIFKGKNFEHFGPLICTKE